MFQPGGNLIWFMHELSQHVAKIALFYIKTSHSNTATTAHEWIESKSWLLLRGLFFTLNISPDLQYSTYNTCNCTENSLPTYPNRFQGSQVHQLVSSALSWLKSGKTFSEKCRPHGFYVLRCKVGHLVCTSGKKVIGGCRERERQKGKLTHGLGWKDTTRSKIS